MALTSVAAGDTAAAGDVNQFKNHLEGEASSTLAWFFRVATSQHFIVQLADNAGTSELRINDSDGTEVASIDSDGNLDISGTFNLGTLNVPTATAPSQTVEGQMIWDSDDDRLTVGDGAATLIITPNGASPGGELGGTWATPR